MKQPAPREAFHIGASGIAPGTRATVHLPVSMLSNQAPVTLPVHVVHGDEAGPRLFISGVVHGDEVMGAEIVRRVLRHPVMQRIAGTLLAVPIVNAYGLISHSRYLPDRRDLNRSFPGSDHGSLASVLADLFMREVVERADYGIDLHTAALHRSNLPQIRISPDDGLMELAKDFGAPVILVSKLRDGSLRHSALQRGVKVLVYEGGEALRFDETAIETAVAGIFRVMLGIGMLTKPVARLAKPQRPTVSVSSLWLRAPEGGIFRTHHKAGDWVRKGEVIGLISDAFGESEVPLAAPDHGILIGQSHLPVVNKGDALFHLARADRRALPKDAPQAAPFDEDEII